LKFEKQGEVAGKLKLN